MSGRARVICYDLHPKRVKTDRRACVTSERKADTPRGGGGGGGCGVQETE